MLPKMDSDDTQIRKWINIGKSVEHCIKQGESPDSEVGQIIAEDVLILSEELFLGNEDLADKFYEIRISPEKSQALNLYPIPREVMQFLEEAIEIYERQNTKTKK